MQKSERNFKSIVSTLKWKITNFPLYYFSGENISIIYPSKSIPANLFTYYLHKENISIADGRNLLKFQMDEFYSIIL